MQENLQKISGVSAAAQQSLLMVGECPSGHEHLASASVWKSLAQVDTNTRELEEQFSDVQDSMERLFSTQATAKSKVGKLADAYKKTIPNLQRRMIHQEQN